MLSTCLVFFFTVFAMNDDFSEPFIFPNTPTLCCHSVVLLYMCWIMGYCYFYGLMDYCYFYGLEFPDVLLLRCFVFIIMGICFAFVAYYKVFQVEIFLHFVFTYSFHTRDRIHVGIYFLCT